MLFSGFLLEDYLHLIGNNMENYCQMNDFFMRVFRFLKLLFRTKIVTSKQMKFYSPHEKVQGIKFPANVYFS